MIPKNITRNNILNAIKEINKKDIPKGRTSRKFKLSYEGNVYPPKYIISLANRYANGKELESSEFSGGEETNNFLTALGFNIVCTPSPEMSALKTFEKRKEIGSLKIHHDERCHKCKETIRNLLEKIYEKAEPSFKFDVGTRPEDFRDTLYYEKLKEIYDALKKHRGFKEFVRAKTLPNCDFFVPSTGFVVEFDESQHFTLPRKIALEHYPKELELGFDRKRWIELCERTDAKNNDPPYRDEQRAWYDTLRDFLPAIKGLKPTVRLFSKDFRWCNLNPEVLSDIKKFKMLLGGKKPKYEIEFKEEPNPFLARIVIAGDWEGDVQITKKLLDEICEMWPKREKVKYLITCGGFLNFDWPDSLQDIEDNKNPNQQIVNSLISEAEKQCRLLLNGRLYEKLRECTDYITIGIDSFLEKTYKIELVAIIDLSQDKWYWTGKSYPTSDQENSLVRISDLETHFANLKGESVIVLGCHDLNLLIDRGKKTKHMTWRKTVKKSFQELAKEKEPTCVLQHPHSTESVNTWGAAWGATKKLLSTVKRYASAGKFFKIDSVHTGSDLDKVLGKTKLGNTIDFVVSIEE